MATQNKIVGLIPCAGKGTRLGTLPFSKELYPIEFNQIEGKQNVEVVSSYLINHMRDAGVNDFHIIIKEGKWDIPTYFSKIANWNLNFCYHITNVDFGVPFSINMAYPFIKDKIVCLGFPDILFKPKKVFNQLLLKLSSKKDISVVLGVMPIDRPDKWDMIEYDSHNKIKRIVIKSSNVKLLKYGWFNAVWNSEFTEYLNSYVSNLLNEKSAIDLKNSEIYLGDVIREAIEDGYNVETVIFGNGTCLDIGTPEDLQLARLFLSE